MNILAKLSTDLKEERAKVKNYAKYSEDYATQRYWDGYRNGLQYALDRLDTLIADGEVVDAEVEGA